MVPANNGFGSGRILLSAFCCRSVTWMHSPARLPQHVHHLCLEHRVYRLNTYTSTALWHRKDIHYSHGKVIHKLSKHQAHDFHRYTSSSMSKHLQERKGGDVDSFGVIDETCIILKGAPISFIVLQKFHTR